MSPKIKEIFELVNLFLTEEESVYFNDADIIYPAEYSGVTNFTRIKIKIKDFLPIHILNKVESYLKNNTLMPTKINFIVDNKDYDTELIWRYIEYVKENKAEVKTGTIKMLSMSSVTYFPEYHLVVFNVKDKLQQFRLEEHKKYYLNKLLKYGFENIDLDIRVDESNAVDVVAEAENHYNNAAKEDSKKISKMQTQMSQNQSVNVIATKTKYKNAINVAESTYENLSLLEPDAQNVVLHGMVFKKDFKTSNAGRAIHTVYITDEISSVKCIFFAKSNDWTIFDEVTDEMKNDPTSNSLEESVIRKGDWVAFAGNYTYSPYDKEYVFYINKYNKIQKNIPILNDDAQEKRIELHTHTKMSVMDGVSNASDYISTAGRWGWSAIAITDHQNVQTFPEAFSAIRKVNSKRDENNKMKLIYGSEINMINESFWYVKNPRHQKLREAKFVVFDLETTDLSPEYGEIIEFGANVYDYAKGTSKKYDILIKPSKPVKKFTTELTGITNDMLENKSTIEVEFKNIIEIIEGGILIAHNANFDFNFLNSWAIKLGYPPLTNTVIDTLALARVLKPDIKNHTLGVVAKKYGVFYNKDEAHRADYDAEVLTNMYEHMWMEAKKIMPVDYDDDWNKFEPEDKNRNMNYIRGRGYHVQVLAKNQKGLKELYKIISTSHTDEFLGAPKIFRNTLLEFKKNNNILIGSGCVNGFVFEMMRTGTNEMLIESISMFDYIEVQPLSVYKNLLQTGDLTEEQLIHYIKTIIKEAKAQNKIVVATGDVHYVDKKLKPIREIYINAKGLGGRSHPLLDFKGRVKDYPEQHLRTTNEMLNDFSFLEDSELIHEIVITNPQKIADQIEHEIEPVKSGSYAPTIENVDKMLTDVCYQTAKEMYGDDLPDIVVKRLEKELNSIIKHGFAVVYWISHKLVNKSMEDGYLVGSRGSVGSSFVATTSQITEVNPLKAHYRCAKCKYSDFDTPEEFKCGYDLPVKQCPKCNETLIGDGHDIPFETFLGFDGDKVPDIDLNFSGEYQPTAHNFTKEMFGENNVFRAGTISSVAEKTAFGYVKGYYEKIGMPQENIRTAEIERLAMQAMGTKRTTGQHPGGIIILPKEYDIEDFTPINFPADDPTSDWKTTHFDFHSIHDNLLKMDILGHVDPTALKMLKDLTGVDPISIPTNDKKVYSLFANLSALEGVSASDIENETTGALGLPEFGTQFVRGMLKETQPSSFADLVQISGLSHGTDVYVGNAQNLIREGAATISTVIGCRDDIMVYLMQQGLNPSDAFVIMESVRKGKGLTKDWIDLMKEHDIPEWYINSCLKIKYMFPKAHATAYVLMAYRVAWYKIYYPIEYYATYFSTRSEQFDLETAIKGPEAVKAALYDIKRRKQNKELVSSKEEALVTVYEILLEMFARNIKMTNIDFNISLAEKFRVVEVNGEKIIYPPFNTIDSLGLAAAESIVNARTDKQIISVNDLTTRTIVTKTQLAIFKHLKITDSLQDDEQLKFDF